MMIDNCSPELIIQTRLEEFEVSKYGSLVPKSIIQWCVNNIRHIIKSCASIKVAFRECCIAQVISVIDEGSCFRDQEMGKVERHSARHVLQRCLR